MWYSPAPNPRSLTAPYPGTPTTLHSRRVVENLLDDAVPGMPYQPPSKFPWPTVTPNQLYNEHPPNGGVLPYGLAPFPGRHRVSYEPPPPMPLVEPYPPNFSQDYLPDQALYGIGRGPEDDPKDKAEMLPWGWIGLTAALLAFGYWRRKR